MSISMTLDQLPQNLLRKCRSRDGISVTLMICRVRRDTVLSPGAVLHTLPSYLKGGGLLFLEEFVKLRKLGLQGRADTSSTFGFVWLFFFFFFEMCFSELEALAPSAEYRQAESQGRSKNLHLAGPEGTCQQDTYLEGYFPH